MTNILRELYRQGAFNPGLPHYELAASHVPFGALGFAPAPEQLLVDAVSQTDGLTLIVGASGAGKSSLMTYVAERLADLNQDGRAFLPLLVPVAAQGAKAAHLGTFGRLAIAALLSALDMPERARRKLDRLTAQNVTRQLPSKDFNARLALRGGPGFGTTLRGEVLSISSAGALDQDAYGGLDELAHLLRGLERELVVMVEDTDAWALEPDRGRETAVAFFAGILAPLHAAGFSVVVAAQTHWSETEAFSAVSERAVARIDLPTYSAPQARAAIATIVSNRIVWALPDGLARPVQEVVDEAAIDVLAARLKETGSIRSALTLLRDALTKVSAEFPEALTREHLLESV